VRAGSHAQDRHGCYSGRYFPLEFSVLVQQHRVKFLKGAEYWVYVFFAIAIGNILTTVAAYDGTYTYWISDTNDKYSQVPFTNKFASFPKGICRI